MRFWAKVDRNGPVSERVGTRCWLWTAAVHQGYGRFRLGGANLRAHVVAYELLVGPVPAGLEIDHLCRVRNCVNPAHMEPVSHGENVRRGNIDRAIDRLTCRRGHPFSGGNLTIRRSDGARICKACGRDKTRRYRARKAMR